MAKKHTPTHEEELLELGKKLQTFYDTGYVNRKQALWFSFLKGAVSGFGAFLGGTLLIALLLGLLRFFTDIPLLGHFMDSLRHTLTQK